ncbi:hypothetical protein RKD29_007721 [Streptomyces tendae]
MQLTPACWAGPPRCPPAERELHTDRFAAADMDGKLR